MSFPAIMPMMTDMVLPAVPETVMIMIWIMRSAVVRKAIPKPPVPKDRKVLTSVPTTVIISKNVFPPVPQITSPVTSLIMVSEGLVTENMLLVKKTLNAPVRNLTPVTSMNAAPDNN